MRPKLKGDTFFVPVADGVLLRNNLGTRVIKGKFVYSWVERLVPYLDGTHTLDELTEGLESEKSDMVRNLVEVLAHGKFLKDAEQDKPHMLSAQELETYAAEIAFVDSFRDSAAYAFECFRAKRVLLIGSDLLLTALVHGSLSCGLRHVGALPLEDDATTWQRVHDYLTLSQQRDPAQTLEKIAAPPDWSDESAVLAVLQPFDAILFAASTPMLAYLQILNRLCRAHRKPFIPAVIVNDHAWIGPLAQGDAGACWECAWRRLQSNQSDSFPESPVYALENLAGAPASQFLAQPTAAIIADLLAFELFKKYTEAGPLDTAGSLIDMDLETAYSQKHAFVSHPLCESCHQPGALTETEFLAGIAQLQQREPDVPEAFSKRAAALFDEALGVFSTLEEGDLIQLPHSTCRVAISNPMRHSPPAYQAQVIGSGVGFKQARQRAAQQACEFYAASIVDRRRLIPDTPTPPGALIMSPEHIFGSDPVPGAVPSSWAWAYSLRGARAYLVPATLAFPALDGSHPAQEARLGVGSGMSWNEAVCCGILSLCRQLTLDGLDAAHTPYPQVDLDATPLQPQGTRQRHLLNLANSYVTVYDVTGALHVPTFAICMDEHVMAYSTHTDVAQALRAGFEEALLRWQLTMAGLVGMSGLPSIPPLPLPQRGTFTVIPSSVAPAEGEACLAWLQQALGAAGWQVFIIPLDHDPALASVLPHLVRVLLARA